MVAPTFDISKSSAARVTRANDEGLRYRLDVVAASAVDVVQSAGGWLYDRAMAGWEVTVLLPQGCNTRSLRILGCAPPTSTPGSPGWARAPPAGRQRRRVHRRRPGARHGARIAAQPAHRGRAVGRRLAAGREPRDHQGPAPAQRGRAQVQGLCACGRRDFGRRHRPAESLLCDVYSAADSELVRLD